MSAGIFTKYLHFRVRILYFVHIVKKHMYLCNKIILSFTHRFYEKSTQTIVANNHYCSLTLWLKGWLTSVCALHTWCCFTACLLTLTCLWQHCFRFTRGREGGREIGENDIGELNQRGERIMEGGRGERNSHTRREKDRKETMARWEGIREKDRGTEDAEGGRNEGQTAGDTVCVCSFFCCSQAR